MERLLIPVSDDLRSYFFGSACYLLYVGFSLGLFFYTEDGGEIILRNFR
jgi:hypothetical protein